MAVEGSAQTDSFNYFSPNSVVFATLARTQEENSNGIFYKKLKQKV